MAKPLTQTTGRRKRAVARVRIRPGTGTITVHKRPVEEYFPSETHRMILTEPLRLTHRLLVRNENHRLVVEHQLLTLSGNLRQRSDGARAFVNEKRRNPRGDPTHCR